MKYVLLCFLLLFIGMVLCLQSAFVIAPDFIFNESHPFLRTISFINGAIFVCIGLEELVSIIRDKYF